MNLTRLLQFNAIAIILISSTIALNAQEISTKAEIYDFEVGDEFHIYSDVDATGYGHNLYLNKKVISKFYSNDGDTLYYIIDVTSKISSSENSQWEWWAYDNYQVDVIKYDLENLINSGNIDSVYSDPEKYNGRLNNRNQEGNPGSSYAEIKKYTVGLGRTYYYDEFNDPPEMWWENKEQLLYYKKGSEEWGSPYSIIDYENILKRIEVFNYDVGDLFHLKESDSSSTGESETIINKEIISKSYSSDSNSVNYLFSVKKKFISLENPEPVCDYYIDSINYYKLQYRIRWGDIDSLYTSSILFNNRMVNYNYTPMSNDSYQIFEYAAGCGETYYKYYGWNGAIYNNFQRELFYYKKGDEEWGTPQHIVSKSFIDPLAEWNVAKTYPHANPQNIGFIETSTRVYGFNGDTIIANEPWLKFYSTPDSNFVSELYYEGSFKEDNGIVLFKDTANVMDTIYNFNLTVGDSVLYNFGWGSNYLLIENIDSVEINGQFHKRYIFEEPDYPPFTLSEVWIEGIGSIHGPLFPKYPGLFESEIPDSLNLTCYKIGNSIIWNNPFYDNCYVNFILSSEEIKAEQCRIFPNPANDYIYLQTDNNNPGDLEINSLSGIIVKKVKLSSNQKIDISKLKPGIYILKIKYENQVVIKKLIKQ